MIFSGAAGALAGALAALALPASAGAAGWSAPFRVIDPQPRDLTGVQLAVSSTGQIAAGFSLYDEDAQASARGFVAVGASPGHPARDRRIPAAQQVLGLTYLGSALELLAGFGARSQPCCASAGELAVTGAGFGRPSGVVGGLTAPSVGSLTDVPGAGLLGTVATEDGVWAAASRGGRLGAAGGLATAAEVPFSAAATATASGTTYVGWLAAPDRLGERGATQVLIARGQGAQPPRRPAALLRAAPGHQLDDLVMAPAVGGATAAFADSWFDPSGGYRSQAVVSDLGPSPRPRAFPIAGQAASGLALAGGAGSQALAFSSCDAGGDCWVRAAFRPSGGRFAAPGQLGAIDPGQEPCAAVGPRGTAVVAWIYRGQVFASERFATSGRFGRPTRLSSTIYASSLVLATGGSRVVAAWTEGTVAPSIVAAILR